MLWAQIADEKPTITTYHEPLVNLENQTNVYPMGCTDDISFSPWTNTAEVSPDPHGSLGRAVIYHQGIPNMIHNTD